MQPIVQNSTTKYAWNRVTPTDLSLKNSHTYLAENWKQIMLATDMINGGIAVLEKFNGQFRLIKRIFNGYTMMWSPYPFIYNGQRYVMVCDTGGGDSAEWWKYMQPYYFTLDDSYNPGPLSLISLPNPDDIGFIDPTMIRIGDWYYLFVADLWNQTDQTWWSPRCFVAETPFGAFIESRSFRMGVPERSIDEAFKAFRGLDGQLLCTWSSGDSGMDGSAYLGKLDSISQSSEGWHKFRVTETACLQATDSDLCTALDVGVWPTLYANLREPGCTDGGREGFFIGELV